MKTKQEKDLAFRQLIEQRKARIAQEKAEANNGRTDFPESLAHPMTPDCQVALYAVTWTDTRGRITGNSWRSKREARKAVARLLAERRLRGTYTTYCAGFAF